MSTSRPSARPVNLNLLRFHFPLNAVTSITHRITGLVLFIGVWALLYLAHNALAPLAAGPSFAEAPLGKLVLLALFGCASFHLFAGVKHLLLDFGIGEHLKTARVLASTAWVLAAALTAVFAACSFM
ncbi:MAG: succinate dehydrogenase, cytochrome b556 subunit [Gammaproteobacteria bacterium]|nr:succinate dehydrogenase, cytochrome b556 subunit [Gammaproteobacteria bacterium]